MDMRSDNSLYNAKNSQTTDRDSSQPLEATRRKFLATSAVGIAGLGAVGSAAAAPEKHTLVIDGTGPVTSYSFTVGGDLEKSTADGATINSGDEIIGRSAHGAVLDGKDAYTFTGPLYSFDFDRSNGLDVDLDGEAAHVGRRPDHTLVIEGFGETADYSFATDSRATPSEAYGASINESTTTNDFGTAGAVRGGKDAFTYSGELRAFDLSGEARVTIDGQAAHVGKRPDRRLYIRGTGGYAEYEFQTSGRIRTVIQKEDGQDNVGTASVSGAISGYGYDAYTYDGGVTALTYSDENAPLVYSNQDLLAKTNY